MLSKNPLPLHAVELQSEDIALRVRTLLAAFCRTPSQHARFLNTLSLLEHIGSRKIMRSQGETSLTHDSLKHLAEETRHAYFFKRAAERFAGHALDYGARGTIAGSAARMYMGRLDAEISHAIAPAPSGLAYLYMSLIVELRAIWFYRHYADVLRESKVRLNLSSLLAEEELHLEAMAAELGARDPAAETRIAQFTARENVLFRKFWRAVEAHCVLADAA